MSTTKRKWPWITAAVLAGLLLVIGWQEWRGWTWLAEPMAARLSAQLHHPVEFDKGFRLRLLGRIRLQIGALTVGQPPWNAGQPDVPVNMLEADEVRLVVPYGGLIRALYGKRLDRVVVDEISLARLEGDFMRDKEGRANWSLDPSGKAPVTPPDSKPATLPLVRMLVVRQGRLAIHDAPLDLDMQADASTSEGQGGSGLVVKGQGRYRGNPFSMEARSTGVLPLLTKPEDAPPMPIVIEAKAGRSRVSFEGQTRDLLRLSNLNGTLKLKGPSLSAIGDAVGVTLPTTAVFDLEGQLGKNGDLWRLEISKLAVGDSRLSGDFSFDRRPEVPLLKGELHGSNLALADLAPAFGATAPGAERNPPPPKGKLLPQREFDVPSLRAMNAEVALRIRQASLGALFARPLAPLEADLSLQSGVLTLSNVVARTADGSVGGSVKLDGRGNKLKWDADLKWSEIKLEKWLSMPASTTKADAKATAKSNDKATQQSGGAGPETTYLSGELAGNAQLKGEGNSTALLLGSLDGHATTWVRDGRASRLIVEALSLHLPEALGLWLGGDEDDVMQCAVVRMTARQGELTPDVAIVDTPTSTVLASGKVTLDTEELDLTLVSYPKTMSLLSLRTPIRLTGPMADPSISLKSNPLGLKVLGAIALSVVNPLAAIVPLIDTGKTTSKGCTQAVAALQGKPGAAAVPARKR